MLKGIGNLFGTVSFIIGIAFMYVGITLITDPELRELISEQMNEVFKS